MTAMHLRERVGNREPQTETTMPSRRRAICLAKTIEDVRQKLRYDADTRVNNRKLRVCAVELSGDAHLPAGFGELDRVRNEVPGNLLQTNRLAQHSQTRRPQRHRHIDIARCR